MKFMGDRRGWQCVIALLFVIIPRIIPFFWAYLECILLIIFVIIVFGTENTVILLSE